MSVALHPWSQDGPPDFIALSPRQLHARRGFSIDGSRRLIAELSRALKLAVEEHPVLLPLLDHIIWSLSHDQVQEVFTIPNLHHPSVLVLPFQLLVELVLRGMTSPFRAAETAGVHVVSTTTSFLVVVGEASCRRDWFTTREMHPASFLLARFLDPDTTSANEETPGHGIFASLAPGLCEEFRWISSEVLQGEGDSLVVLQPFTKFVDRVDQWLVREAVQVDWALDEVQVPDVSLDLLHEHLHFCRRGRGLHALLLRPAFGLVHQLQVCLLPNLTSVPDACPCGVF